MVEQPDDLPLLTTQKLVEWLREAGQTAALEGNDVPIYSFSHDTRKLARGALYIALSGGRTEGSDYALDAQRRGAAAVLVQRSGADVALPQVVVTDAQHALTVLATRWRAQWSLPLVAITGSSGKTTVKNLLASIVMAEVNDSAAVLATQGNFNNAIGLPLTLLRLRAPHCYAVVEIGMSQAGEIAHLSSVAQPTVALINNVQPAHLLGVGSVEAVACAKAEIFEGLHAAGTAIFGAENPFAERWRDQLRSHSILTFGQRLADVRLVEPDSEPSIGGAVPFRVQTPIGMIETQLHLLGRHNALNAAAATAAAVALGCSACAIAAGISNYLGYSGRLQLRPACFGGRLIDDSYNANPASVCAALDVLADMPGKRVMVLGAMGELGEKSAEFHHEVGDYAIGRADRLFAIGQDSGVSAAAFGGQGRYFETFEALLKAVAAEADPQSTVLVKGSRSQRMERVVEFLAEKSPCSFC